MFPCCENKLTLVRLRVERIVPVERRVNLLGESFRCEKHSTNRVSKVHHTILSHLSIPFISRFFELRTSLTPAQGSYNSTLDGDDVEAFCARANSSCKVSLKPTALRLDSNYKIYYCGWINSLFCGFIPFFTLIVLNLLTLR